VAREVRGWFRTSAPEIGYVVQAHWYGLVSDLGGAETRLILGIDSPGHVPAALAAVRADGPDRTVTIWVDDRERASRLDRALRENGCTAGDATTHLALVGPMSPRPVPDGLRVEIVEPAGLEEWARVKLRCFDDSEAAPSPDRIATELAARLEDLPLVEHWVGSLGREHVAVLAFYVGQDQLVFSLGTRVPYRHRGVATALLTRWVDLGTARGARSLIINAHDGGRPAELYRGLGFVDEVYWYRKYELAGGSAPAG
jgi:hypothetical protein